MTVNTDAVSFYSGYPIDKIVLQGNATYTVAAGVPSTLSPYPSSLQTIANTYGQKALITASWSIDGTNFNSTLSSLNYILTGQYVPQALVTCGISANSIYFYIVNNFNTSLTFDINYAVYTIS